MLDLGGPEWDGYGGLHGRRQAFRIERERRLVKQGADSRETAYGLTSLGAGTVLALFLCQWNLCDASRVFPYCSAVYCESRRLVGLPAVRLIALRLCQAGCC